MATSLEGFSVTSHENRVPGAPFKGKKGYKEHPPALKIKVVMSKVVFSGLLTEIRCWKSFPAKFDAPGKLFTDFPAARNAIPAKVWAFSRKENGCWKIDLAFGNVPGFSPLRPPQPSWVSLSCTEMRYYCLAIPRPWYECQSSSSPQKCLWRVRNVIWGVFWPPLRKVSRTVQTILWNWGLQRGV